MVGIAVRICGCQLACCEVGNVLHSLCIPAGLSQCMNRNAVTVVIPSNSYQVFLLMQKREKEFDEYRQERVVQAKLDYRELLKETKIITYKYVC